MTTAANETTDDQVPQQPEPELSDDQLRERLEAARARMRVVAAPRLALPVASGEQLAAKFGPGGMECPRRCECGVTYWAHYRAPVEGCPACLSKKVREGREQIRAAALSQLPGNSAATAPRARGFHDMVFGSKTLTVACPHLDARRRAEAAASFSSVTLVAILGETGAGKTSLAAAMFRRAADRVVADGATATDEAIVRGLVWQSALELSQARHQTRRGIEVPLVQRAMTATLLVLDDLGQVPEVDKDDVKRVIAHREENGLPMVVTHGHGMAGLLRLGADTLRRLDEGEGRLILKLGGRS